MEEAFRQAAGVASALAYMHDEAMPVSVFVAAWNSLRRVLACPFCDPRCAGRAEGGPLVRLRQRTCFGRFVSVATAMLLLCCYVAGVGSY